MGPTGPAGAPGATGATGPPGSEAELNWEEVESFGAGVENYGEEYAPLRWALGGNGEVYLTGLLKLNEEKPVGSTLFTLPPAARPAYKKVIWIGNADNVKEGALFVVRNGEVKTVSTLSPTPGWVPAFEGVLFAKSH
jgi:hypothetical protein